MSEQGERESLSDLGQALKLDSHSASPPQELVLFRTVILQAILDATKPATHNEPEEEALAREQAISWFFASIGVTAQDFMDVCDMAGLDPNYVRTFAHKVLRTREINYVRKRINTVLNGSK
jgi:hypothetical protein